MHLIGLAPWIRFSPSALFQKSWTGFVLILSNKNETFACQAHEWERFSLLMDEAFKAYQAGLSQIPVYYDWDDLNWDFYQCNVQACEKRHLLDSCLQNRICQEDYQE